MQHYHDHVKGLLGQREADKARGRRLTWKPITSGPQNIKASTNLLRRSAQGLSP